MKTSKKLKVILMILISILIILIGICGIYVKKGNSYKNILPEYELSSDLKGATVLEFEVNEGSNTVYYDKNGKEVDSNTVTEENKKDYTSKEIAINSKEVLTVENYKKSMDIMKKRLKFLNADQYKLDLDEKSGKIFLTFKDDYPDDIQSILSMEGKLELKDSNTNDVIINYQNFESAEATYAAIDDGSYVIYINLKLNDSGIEKINNIESYKKTVSDNGETKTNNLKIIFDKDEIAEISYDDTLLIGKTLRITTAKDLKTDSEINSELNTDTVISKLATIGKMPVVYSVAAEEYIQSTITDNIKYIVLGLISICVLISIYLVARYKFKGLLAVLAFAANISLFLIIIRLTSIEISLNGFAGILGLIILNTILINNILKLEGKTDKVFSERIKSAYIKTIDAFVVTLIIFVVFAFSNMTVISSMGLLAFWGWLVILLGNLVLTVPILASVNK